MAVTRYQALADDIAHTIRVGLLREGDKLPSVRETCASRGVSPSTVFQAYYLLEARGLVRARPRSGYYVRALPGALPPEPETTRPGEHGRASVRGRVGPHV